MCGMVFTTKYHLFFKYLSDLQHFTLWDRGSIPVVYMCVDYVHRILYMLLDMG